MKQPTSQARPALRASYVLRVEQQGGRLSYLLQNLRSGEQHRFCLPSELQRWLSLATHRGLK